MAVSVSVIDDECFDRKLVRSARGAAARGTMIIDAHCAKDALGLAPRLNWPCAILTDLRMPVMDGSELIARLNSDPHTRDLPVIAIP